MNTEPDKKQIVKTTAEKPSIFEQMAKTFIVVASGITETTHKVIKQTHQMFEQATSGAGHAVDFVGNNWLIRNLSGVLNLNWLLGVVDTVDLQKAEAAVKKLYLEHPQESASQIAHRIMLEKATYAGGLGLASSILPGAAAALFAVDLAATMKLQSEMIYQIASAYGLNLQDSARKGEVLGIFGLGLGGGRLMKAAGLSLLRNIPFAGAVIGASSNATMIYSLGYAACRFYEAKLDNSQSLTSAQTLAALKAQSADYLQTALAQQAVVDQVLVHMFLASYPERTWAEILPELQTLNLTAASLDAIAKNIQSPQPLETLLNQLNRDFAIPLLAQCERIAQLDRQITPSELQILDAIALKFEIPRT